MEQSKSAKEHSFKINDLVLKQEKSNKLITAYKHEQCIVCRIPGSSARAHWKSNGQAFCDPTHFIGANDKDVSIEDRESRPLKLLRGTREDTSEQ